MSNAIATIKNVDAMLKSPKIQERLKDMLDNNSAAFCTSIINAINGNSMLQNAEPQSIVKSAMVAAALKLPIDTNLGFAAIVPYKNKDRGVEAQFQIMYKGLTQLAIRSGQYETINVAEVYEDELDNFDPFTGDVKFKPHTEWKMRYETDGKVVGYYAYFRLLTGFKKNLYMTKGEVEKHALTYSQSYKSDKSKGWTSSRWSQDFDAMARKTVLKQLLSKYGILSVEMQSVMKFDQARVGGTIDNPQPEYVDNPDFEEVKEEPINPFKDAVDVDFTGTPFEDGVGE
jgi:recombination protein RecT